MESNKGTTNSNRLGVEKVIDEAQFSEPLHEEANPRPRGADHFCQRLMTNVWNHAVMRGLSIKMGKQQESARQSFLAGIAALVHQILLVPHVPSQHVGTKQV